MRIVCGEVITMLRELRPVIAEIERRDDDLGQRMRRAGSGVAVNCAEAQSSRGKHQQMRLSMALDSMRDAMECLDAARAFGYTQPLDGAVTRRMGRIYGMLSRLALCPTPTAGIGVGV
jgi:four helix bundle protein